MVKPLSFKGDKKPKKRKRAPAEEDPAAAPPGQPGASSSSSTSTAVATAPALASEDPEGDESWVLAEAAADVVGPVILVLPTSPPTCLACDANGKVFADEIVNIVDANPATAEPHNVRQVWVANSIAGTDKFRFKGRYGKYLSCDEHGILSATSEAIAPPETWAAAPTADTPGTFQLQTARDTYLSARDRLEDSHHQQPEVRGDAASPSFETALRVRMQARFKPRLRATREGREREKVSRRELEAAAGRRLDEDEVRRLKRARRDGDYHEQLLDLKTKGKHDKYG